MKTKLSAALLALALSAALGVTGCEEKQAPTRPADQLTRVDNLTTPDPGLRPEPTDPPTTNPPASSGSGGPVEPGIGAPAAAPDPGSVSKRTTKTPAKPVGFSFTPAKPPAPAARVIEVVDQISPSAWRVSAAVAWMDGYTASKARMVSKCSGKAYRCVTFRQGRVSGGSVGWSSGYTVTIDVAKANSSQYYKYYKSDSYRTWLLAHEFGHQFGLGHRSDRNLMNSVVTKGALVLNSGQKTHLRAR